MTFKKRKQRQKLICFQCDDSVSNIQYYIDADTNEKVYYCDNCSMEAPREDFM